MFVSYIMIFFEFFRQKKAPSHLMISQAELKASNRQNLYLFLVYKRIVIKSSQDLNLEILGQKNRVFRLCLKNIDI